MCGVFGYVGEKIDVGGEIVKALRTLEYRGYDSWGLAVASDAGLVVDKATGRLNGHIESIRARVQGSVTPGGQPTAA